MDLNLDELQIFDFISNNVCNIQIFLRVFGFVPNSPDMSLGYIRSNDSNH